MTARRLRKSVTAGLSSASFCRIASALRYSASASADLPQFVSRMARPLWLAARLSRNAGDGGVVVGQFLLDRQRLAVLGLRFRNLARRTPADRRRSMIVTRQVPPRLGRRPGGVGQRLLVRSCQAVDRQGFVVVARGLEEPAETRPAVSQDSPHRGGPPRSSGPVQPAGSPPCGTSLPPPWSVRWPPADRRWPSGCAPRPP